MREPFANAAAMDNLKDCIRKTKGSFDKNECLQTICEALAVIMINQGEILSKILEGSDGRGHINDCISKIKGVLDRNECLQTICEELMVILKNQGELLSTSR
ncbi:MAG: hypothetical protein PVG39_31060 [Desulfobacteraceae bacterium]